MVLFPNINYFRETMCYENPAICYSDNINPKVTLKIRNTMFEDC